MSKFKVGDFVTVSHNARSQRLNNPTSYRVKRCIKPAIPQKWIVLGVNCAIPIGFNRVNTVIMAEESEAIYAINNCDLQAWREPIIEMQFMTNGRNVTATLSEQSKNAILRAYLGG